MKLIEFTTNKSQISAKYKQVNLKLLSLTKKEWANLSDEYFQELFKKSAVKRTKKSGLDRNIDFVQKKSK